MELLEREPFLGELAELLNEAATGSGRTVLLSGEAGIGKSALIEHFTEQHADAARVLWGACEALFTPRPLGPLHDVAFQIQSDLRSLLETQAPRATIFSAVLSELDAEERPTVLVFEDVHWADEATLDLIKFLGRRIHRMRVLFVVTYRDDEVGTDHPLRLVLGDLPRRHAHRLTLPPLSEAAVAALAKRMDRPSDDVYAATGGNPFFVTEVLASARGGVSVTVRDAVLARASRLSAAAQEVLELVSVVPAKTERWLLDAVLAAPPPVLDECLESGMLRLDGEALAFRHELARRAVEDALPPSRRQRLHAAVLAALAQHDHIEVARLVHHADRAGDGAAVLQHAPRAATRAAALGAHREAASHYATALRYARALPPEERAPLLEAWSYECHLINRIDDALAARQEALALWKQMKRPREQSENLRWISKLYWLSGQRAQAERYAEEAVAVLEPVPPCEELAYAYCNRANLHMLAEEVTEAVRLGSRAIELVEAFGPREGPLTETLINSFHSIGMALLLDQDDYWRWGMDYLNTAPGLKSGRAELEKSLRLALKHGYQEYAARAYTNLACEALIHRDYERAARYFDDGIAYCTTYDLDAWRYYLIAHRAHMRFEQGDWTGAADDASSVLSHSQVAPVTKIPALVVLGRIRVRRGVPDTAALLDEARDLARPTGELARIGPVAIARAEAAWLNGRLDEARDEARAGFALALRSKRPWALGELGFWMWRAGGLEAPPQGAALPFALHMAGNWRAAAECWQQLGCPYERAMALSDGDEAAQFEALDLFEELGAEPAAELLRRTMQVRGIQGIPRGPRPSTQENPAGLTARQMDVLALLAEGLSNADIAERLFISPKTVDHHVSAILGKLGVHSRTEAAALALQQGLLRPDTDRPA